MNQSTLSPATIAATNQRNEENLRDLRARFDAIATIDVARLDYRAMLESGAIVTLKVNRYRGIQALGAIDLGIDAQEINQVKEILSLGHRLLLPASVLGEFNSLETRARQIVRSHCMLTKFGLFITPNAWAKLGTALEPFKVKFDEKVEELIANLPTHYDRMLEEYATLARQVKTRLEQSGSYTGWAFQEDFITRCMIDFPTAEKLRGSFNFALSIEFIPLTYSEQSANPTYAAASDDLLSMRRAVLEEQQNTRQALVNDFLTSVQSEIFTLINESMGDVLAAIDNGSSGAIAGRSSVQLRNLIDKLVDLNFWNDPRVDLMREKITELLDRAPSVRDSSLTRATLEEIKSRARVAILTLERAQPIDVISSQPAPTITLRNPSDTRPAINVTRQSMPAASPVTRANRPF